MEFVYGLVLGIFVGAGGLFTFMFRDWQECKRVAKLMALRLEEDAKAKKAK